MSDGAADHLERYLRKAADLQDPQAADELYRAGIKQGEEFIKAGETDARVRDRILALYLSAGLNALDHLLDPGATDELHRAGIKQGEEFIKAGETDAGVRERLLALYSNAGNNAQHRLQDPRAADKLYRAGIKWGKRFIKARETNSLVRDRILALYYNAGLNAVDRLQDPRTGDRLYRVGIKRGEAFIDAGETDAWVHEHLLGLYFNAGCDAVDRLQDWGAADELYRAGIVRGEAFIDAGETNARVRKHLLGMYSNAGLNAGDRLQDLRAADKLYRAGIDRGEGFIAAGETDTRVREALLQMYANAGINSYPGNLTGARHDALRLKALLWQTPTAASRQFTPPFSWTRGPLALMPLPKVLPQWRHFLYHWLLRCHGDEAIGQTREALQVLIRSSEALLLLDHSRHNGTFVEQFKGLVNLDARVRSSLVPWQAELDRHHSTFRRCAKHLLSAEEPPDTMKTLADALEHRLAKLSAWERLWRWSTCRQVSRALAGYRELTTTRRPRAEALWSDISRCRESLAAWLAKRILEYRTLPESLDTPGAAALGLLLAAQGEEPVSVVTDWQRQPPWSEDDALRAALDRTRWQEWTIFPDGTRAALYAWKGLIASRRLNIAYTLLNEPEPTLDRALRAYAGGDALPLRQLLESAWSLAWQQAQGVAQVLTALSNPTLESLTAALIERKAPVPGGQLSEALAAVILGDTRQVLQKAILAFLDRQHPLAPTDPLDAALYRVKQRFSRITTLYPGPLDYLALGNRLHTWCQRALALELTSPVPDLDRVWATLEQARVVLTGLRMASPSSDWEKQTANEILTVIQSAPDTAPHPGAVWPPLSVWLKCAEAIIPAPPSVEECRRRLRTGEALVQLFFDPDTGALHALWLVQGQPLDWRHFRPEAEQHYWQDPDKPPRKGGVLDRWGAWIKEERCLGFETDLWPEVMNSKPVQSVASTLQGWAELARIEHLVVLFPAPLAQLPWEALPVFSGGCVLERAVSLACWRTTRPPEPDVRSAAGIFYDSEPHSARFGKDEAQCAGRFWKSPPRGTGEDLTAFDVLASLRQRRNGHLILHGCYQPFDPRVSHLRLTDTERLQAWTMSAVGLAGGQWGLSACQANLSGHTARDLLGPVGVGPALVASGAERVIGSLWSCDQVASWVFHDLLFSAAGRQPTELWARLVLKAKMRLREMGREELRGRLVKTLGESAFRTLQHEFDYLLAAEQPFFSRFYWAPFILLGADTPAPRGSGTELSEAGDH